MTTVGIRKPLTVAETAEFLRTSERQVRRLIKSGALRATRLGPQKTVVGQAALDEFLAGEGWEG